MHRYIAYTKDYNYRFFDAKDVQWAEYKARKIYGDNLHHVELYEKPVRLSLAIVFCAASAVALWLFTAAYVNRLY